MATKVQPNQPRTPSHPIYLNEGLSPKKTALIIVTVIGCIAILWPKVFYPMMFGTTTVKQTLKEQRGPGGCCDVVLDREKFLNSTPLEFGPQLYRKKLNLLTGEMSLRQERPAHLHPESIYQAMRERGRAIPPTQTVPIVERKTSPSNPPPRIVEGRPGPIPGMRPPMGAGALHQPQQKGNSMGFIMPLYTIGIIVFFGYTIMKLVFKKPVPNAPYGPAPTDPNFRKEVFGQENGRHVEDLNGTKLGWREHQTRTNQQEQSKRNGSELYNASLSAANVATNLSTSLKQHHQHQQQYQQTQNLPQQQQQQKDIKSSLLLGFNKETEQLMEIEKLRKKLEDTERAMAKLIAEMNSDQFEAKQPSENSTTETVENTTIGHTNTISTSEEHTDNNISKQAEEEIEGANTDQVKEGTKVDSPTNTATNIQETNEPTEHQRNKRENSQDRSVTSKAEDEFPEPQSIYLEGALPHESQILVADAETRTEEVYDKDLNGSLEEPAVILSSKMTLSLINLDANEENDNENSKCDVESPLADDIEIIGHEEH